MGAIKPGETAPGQPYAHGASVTAADGVVWRWDAGGFRYCGGAKFRPGVWHHLSHESLVDAVGEIALVDDPRYPDSIVVVQDGHGGFWTYQTPGFYADGSLVFFRSLEDLNEAHGPLEPVDEAKWRAPHGSVRDVRPPVEPVEPVDQVDAEPARLSVAPETARLVEEIAEFAWPGQGRPSMAEAIALYRQGVGYLNGGGTAAAAAAFLGARLAFDLAAAAG